MFFSVLEFPKSQIDGFLVLNCGELENLYIACNLQENAADVAAIA